MDVLLSIIHTLHNFLIYRGLGLCDLSFARNGDFWWDNDLLSLFRYQVLLHLLLQHAHFVSERIVDGDLGSINQLLNVSNSIRPVIHHGLQMVHRRVELLVH